MGKIQCDESQLLRVQLDQMFVDVRFDLRDADARVPPHHRLPVRTHQELFEVPLDVAEFHGPPEQSGGVSEEVSDWRAGALRGREQRY